MVFPVAILDFLHRPSLRKEGASGGTESQKPGAQPAAPVSKSVGSESVASKSVGPTGPHNMLAYHTVGAPQWSGRDIASLARNGVERNAIVYRCVRLIAEAAASTPLKLCLGHEVLNDHPVLDLLNRPNDDQSGTVLLEALYGFLQTAGNSYLKAITLDGVVRELHVLRADRVTVRVGRDGWVSGYEYSAGQRKLVFPVPQDASPSPVLHLKLFHPLNDHYGLSPLQVAGGNVDLHNAALAWNKALLDNSARPSGALIYSGPDGAEALSPDQFDRLKAELSDAYSGAGNAGRPLLLEGGLDWRAMSLSPADMDFIQTKNNAAREIALAFGVPPMLLGIPGDNTYANYREANMAFWKQTILPLVKKLASALNGWLIPQIAPDQPGLMLRCDAADLEALSSERDALWRRVTAATFLNDDEKRMLLGLPAQSDRLQGGPA